MENNNQLIDLLTTTGNTLTCPVAVLYRGQSILMGLRNYKPGLSVWTLPGGRCEMGETIEQALRREVKEETGIIDFKIQEPIGNVAGAKKGDIVLVFFATTEQNVILMEPEKFIKWQWVPISNYILDGIYSEMNPEVQALVVKYFKEKDLLVKKNLKFKPHLVEKILSGQKTITWRLFDDKNLQIGDNLNCINSETGEVFAQAVIVTCVEKAIKDLTSEDLKAHENSDHAQVLELNRKYYGDEVGENTMVKIIEFRTL